MIFRFCCILLLKNSIHFISVSVFMCVYMILSAFSLLGAGMLHAGVSGMTLTHSDLGGYTSIDEVVAGFPLLAINRSKELLLRWCEVRAGGGGFGGLPRANPVQCASHDSVPTHAAKLLRAGIMFQAFVFLKNIVLKPYLCARIIRSASDHPVGRPQLSAFTAAYRTHAGNLPQLNAQFWTDADTLAQFRCKSFLVDLRHATITHHCTNHLSGSTNTQQIHFGCIISATSCLASRKMLAKIISTSDF